jgi:exopolysaccharide biosynthesis polyprenyl glycosylphosphotransferase
LQTKKKIHFELSERKILLRVFDVVFVHFGLFIIGELFDFDYFKVSGQKWIWTLILATYLLFFGSVLELYNIYKASKLDVILKGIVVTASLTVLFFLLTPFYTPTLPENRLQIIYFYLAVLGSLLLWRFSYSFFISSPIFIKKVLLIAEGREVNKIIEILLKSDPNYRIIAFIDVCDSDSIIKPDLKKLTVLSLDAVNNLNISEIIITAAGSRKIDKATYTHLLRIRERGFSVKNYIQVYEELTNKLLIQNYDKDFRHYFPFSEVSTDNRLYLAFQRITDILFSVIGLCGFVLLLPIVLIANMIGNRGPLMYSQERIGQHGTSFMIYKLRSMVVNAEENGAVWATKNDVRVTKFGRFLRKTRIDELPQFYNILKGEMSVIGPRPERQFFIDQLSKEIPFYETRNIIKPGLTGWAQVNTEYGATVSESLEKLQYDLYYIKHRGVFIDLQIIKKTLSTVIFFRGR